MKLLVSYANNEYFYRAQHKLVESAKKYFDAHASFTPDLLDDEFKVKNNHILSQKRGAGYWLWKPYIIYTCLKKVKDGDYVFYVDSGNTVINDPEPLFKLVDKEESGIFLFENRDGSQSDKEMQGKVWLNYLYTKYDCFKLMGCLDEKYVKGEQVDGCYILVKKNPFVLKFFEEYIAYCENENILTDKPNEHGENFKGFRDHRHDQSVLSLLAIKYNLTKGREPSEWGNYVSSEKYTYPQIFWHHRGLG